MALYLDTRGHRPLSIAICARCSVKMPRDELFPDPNYPGLLVCRDDLDVLDPWRLPARPADILNIQDPRPDTTLSLNPIAVPINQLQAVLSTQANQNISVGGGQPGDIAAAAPVTQLNQAQPWGASQSYPIGAQVLASQPYGFAPTPNLFLTFLCIIPGTSGATPPTWPTSVGVEVLDGTVMWLSQELFLPF